MGFSVRLLLFAFLSCLTEVVLPGNAQSLPYMKNVLRQPVTVSGFSSGGTMASQLTVAYSSLFSGVGMLSSVYYRCGRGGQAEYNTKCQKGDIPVNQSIADAKNYDSQKLIDPLTNLSNQKVYLWMGSEDQFVTPEVRSRTKDFYGAFIPDAANIKTVIMNATHEYPTDNPKYATCPFTDPNDKYIGNCNYSGGFETLSFLLGPSIQRPAANIKLQTLTTFAQAEFAPNKILPVSIGLAAQGLIYVPTNCTNASFSCRLHMFLHGCSFGLQAQIENFIKGIGIIEVAEQNNIVMIFPRATLTLTNTNGCWDMFASNGDNYATKNGAQVLALRKMIAKVLGDTV